MAKQQSTAFGGLLRQLRNEEGLSIEALADRSNVSEHAISDLELGKAKPREKTVARLAWGLRLQGSVKDRFVAVARGLPVTDGLPVIGAKAPPRTLPRDVGSFTGRVGELARLADQAAGDGGVVSIHAIGGMAGVGKTVLAVHAAHRLASRFPDGQIFLELNGHTPGRRPVDPADALASMLETAGADAREIPAGVSARARLWRHWLAGKRVLLLLDDAVDSDQVRALLPGTPGVLVLITSRSNLTALDDAHAIRLDVLTDKEAAGLLVRLADRPGLDPEDPALAQIAGMCGNLPLALGMLGRRLHLNPAWTPADLAEQLAETHDRLAELRSEKVSVAAAFDLSYRDLTEGQQRMFRRLGLHPGADTDVWASAALGDIGPADADRHLQALYDQNMIAEPVRGRYRFHDLIREYARALAATEDAPAERDAAVGRLLDFYLYAGAAAGRHLARRTPAWTPPDLADNSWGAQVPNLPDRRRAVTWMAAERLNLQAVAEYAAAHGQLLHAIGIPAVMHGFLRGQGHWGQAAALHQAAVAAAERQGDRLGEAGALTDLADAQYLTGNYAAAEASLTRALELSRDLDNLLAEANALAELGVLQQAKGDIATAEASLTRALELSRARGDRLGEAGALNNLGIVQFVTGNLAAAAENQKRALEIYGSLRDALGRASALNALGGVRQATGDYPAARDSLMQALELYRRLGDRIGEAYATGNLGALKCMMEDFADAVADMNLALELYRELGSVSGEADTLCNLGSLQRQTRDYRSASVSLMAAIKLYRDLGDQLDEAGALGELGALQHATGQYQDAEASLLRAVELAHDIGERADEAESLNNLADLYLDTAAPTNARKMYARALTIAAGIGLSREEARARDGLLRSEQAAEDTATPLSAAYAVSDGGPEHRRRPVGGCQRDNGARGGSADDFRAGFSW